LSFALFFLASDSFPNRLLAKKDQEDNNKTKVFSCNFILPASSKLAGRTCVLCHLHLQLSFLCLLVVRIASFFIHFC